MFCGMLEVNPKSDQFNTYFGMAKMLRPELEKIDGFIDNARYTSLTRPGWLLSLSSWRDEKSLVRWSVEASHHKIMQMARDRVFADYRMHIGEFVADTRLPAGQTLLQQRLDVTEAGTSKAITLLDVQRDEDWVKQADADAVVKSLGFNPGTSEVVAWDVFDAIATPGEVIALVKWGDLATLKLLHKTLYCQTACACGTSASFATMECSIDARRRNTLQRLIPRREAAASCATCFTDKKKPQNVTAANGV